MCIGTTFIEGTIVTGHFVIRRKTSSILGSTVSKNSLFSQSGASQQFKRSSNILADFL